jgi:transposase-like protein
VSDAHEGMKATAAKVAGIFPNENAVVRLIAALLLEQNEEWAVHCARYDNGSSRAVAR